MSNAIASNGVSIATIFDPYQSGQTKARASGIADAGTDISNLYANIIYGSAAAATGIQSEGADLNTLYAALGSTQQQLGFAGLYSSAFAGRNNTSLTFPTSTTWSVTTNGAWQGSPPAVSGSLTTYGSVNQFFLHMVDVGSVNTQLTTAPQDVWTPITAGLLVVKFDTFQLFGNATEATFTVSLRNSGGATTSVTTTQFQIHNTNPN